MEEQTSVPSRSGELLTKSTWHFKRYTGRRVTGFYDPGAALALDMEVRVSKMEESIEARIQASWKTAQDPDGAVPSVS